MRKIGLAAIMGAGAFALALSGQALAADLPVKAKAAPAAPDWDIAFGGGIASDYLFRGITQSNHGPSASAYFEPHYKEFYIGIAGAGIDWPAGGTFALNSPSAEIDLYGGWRPTVGKWSFDLGYIYYLYPNHVPLSNGGFNSDFQEFYAKATYAVTDAFAVGGAIYYSPNLSDVGKHSAYYELNAKYTLPSSYFPKDWGGYVSGAYGRLDIEGGPTLFSTTAPSGPFAMPSFNTWNAGVGFTYKVFTLDLRYSDTSLSSTGCIHMWNSDAAISTSLGGWCRSTFIAKLSFDVLASQLK
jgi:uncharacterized protein (TIGR02001 family)